MVFFALTRAGLDEITRQLGRAPSPLWVNEGVMTDAELAELRDKGADVTNFNCRIAPDDTDAIEFALSTVAEHHVGERIWVER
jgi:hypothetical protein